MAYSRSLSWSSDGGLAEIRDINGQLVAPQALNTIWWRRVMIAPDFDEGVDASARLLIPAECRAAMAGMMFVDFQGRWVNDPAAEVRADNKLVQLSAAIKAGLTVPNTLVSADPNQIRHFVEQAGGQAIVKVVRGTSEFSIPTRRVTADDLVDDTALEACPAIYQELIDGETHLRVHVFGRQTVAIQIESSHLDWRPDLQVPMRQVGLPDALSASFIALVQDLGLAMGIIDAKISQNGKIVFLEINPQGQFLFMEGLTGEPLSLYMAAFLTATEYL
ncbi:hypothetical protein H0A66_05620 [Alcaligenaceae bacterium]|nr:hypothetical protein [Alcaligenaceae bacterium]